MSPLQANRDKMLNKVAGTKTVVVKDVKLIKAPPPPRDEQEVAFPMHAGVVDVRIPSDGLLDVEVQSEGHQPRPSDAPLVRC